MVGRVGALLIVLAVGVAVGTPAPVSAQQPSAQQAEPPAQPARKAKKPRARQPEPELDEADQLSPRQLEQRPATRPARPVDPARAEPLAGSVPAAAPPAGAPATEARPAPARAAEPARVVACTGPFGKEASHLKLAQRFDSRNITYAEVEGQEGAKMRASVLYPGDPKRRLEVVWQNEASRSQTYLIVINGQSTWAGPKGLRLGLGLAALEKINGKPFKISGFDQPNGGSVIDWQGGGLESLPGCRLGLRLAPDAKAPEPARSEVNGKEFLSSDAPMRAVKPIVAEILFGF
jgi:hypothetical protein